MMSRPLHVVVLGASPKTSRFSNQAVRLLKERGFHVTPVHPSAPSVEGLQAVHSLAEVAKPVHTLTLYVRPAALAALSASILELAPERVIFNPGTGHPDLEKRLERKGILIVRDCTLIMLRSGRF